MEARERESVGEVELKLVGPWPAEEKPGGSCRRMCVSDVIWLWRNVWGQVTRNTVHGDFRQTKMI